jgi:hypothetical protein
VVSAEKSTNWLVNSGPGPGMCKPWVQLAVSSEERVPIDSFYTDTSFEKKVLNVCLLKDDRS